MIPSGSQGHGGSISDSIISEVYGRQFVAHLPGFVTAILRVAVPELAGIVYAPALHRTIVEDRTAELISAIEVDSGSAGTKVDHREAVAHLAGPVTTGVRVAVPELAVKIVAPALHRSVLEDRTGEVPSGSDHDRCWAGTKVDHREAVAHLAGPVTAILRVAVPELAGGVEAPALD